MNRCFLSNGDMRSAPSTLASMKCSAHIEGSFTLRRRVVVDIDGDGSFLMNCQEMATAAIEGLDIKMFILNNQHLGMVVQWEDRFYKVPQAFHVSCSQDRKHV